MIIRPSQPPCQGGGLGNQGSTFAMPTADRSGFWENFVASFVANFVDSVILKSYHLDYLTTKNTKITKINFLMLCFAIKDAAFFSVFFVFFAVNIRVRTRGFLDHHPVGLA